MALEFVRLADMLEVNGVKPVAADRIKDMLLDKREQNDYNRNTRHLISGHLQAASDLPVNHPVRKVLVAAAIRGCMRTKPYNSRFLSELRKAPDLAVDILKEIPTTLRGINFEEREVEYESVDEGECWYGSEEGRDRDFAITFKDPLTGEFRDIKQFTVHPEI